MWQAAALGAGASMFGGEQGRRGQRSANRTNIQIARERMAWEQTMSSTAHQRETKDLEAAGLNRILGVSGSGSSTPSGANPMVQSEMESVASSAKEMPRMIADLNQIKANTQLTKAQTEVVRESGVTSAKSKGVMERMKFDVLKMTDKFLRRLGAQGSAAVKGFPKNVQPIRLKARELLKRKRENR